ncbi:hypothetical protein BDW42DRAFT_158781 [Aspergillus taichungensis]|uniref:Killer toxin Kp4 domain-containing protein n=1 Tax=Aspergillus taichungensis TaxID=482145 RepID=A0A2J5I952_9EURO|nr:hypothetical protein BDW42DRAFT_158781 [Aspergillus taichungensis]
MELDPFSSPPSSAPSTSRILGINCSGSGGCAESGTIGGSDTRLSHIKNKIDSIDDNKHYNNRDHIACKKNKLGAGISASFQSGAKRLGQKVINHECTACGSVPTGKENVLVV